jgi:thiamine biosynthesis lipoprotein
MGVQVRIVLYADGEPRAKRAAAAAFARFAELEQIMSDYRPTSELMQLCRRAAGRDVTVSCDLWRVLVQAQETAALSDGAFDVTVGPLVRLWRESRRSGRLPSEDSLDDAVRRSGWRMLHLNPEGRSVRLDRDDMLLDLGGIAKGYANDEALRTLRRFGIGRALVEAGGDISVWDAPPGSAGWRVELPNGRIVLLRRQAVSTSGDESQFVEIGGRRYSHVVDTRTGLGMLHQRTATVTAPTGLLADPLSKVAAVLGVERASRLAERYRGVRVH